MSRPCIEYGPVGRKNEKQSGGCIAIDIRYSREALKFLARLDKKTVSRIRQAVYGLTLQPPVGDIKPLQGYSDHRKRLRVGSFRVIYRCGMEGQAEILLVLDIGNRGGIYKRR